MILRFVVLFFQPFFDLSVFDLVVSLKI